jgi:hypothetical protein
MTYINFEYFQGSEEASPPSQETIQANFEAEYAKASEGSKGQVDQLQDELDAEEYARQHAIPQDVLDRAKALLEKEEKERAFDAELEAKKETLRERFENAAPWATNAHLYREMAQVDLMAQRQKNRESGDPIVYDTERYGKSINLRGTGITLEDIAQGKVKFTGKSYKWAGR